ncbi:MAG: Ig-like domain-containing protein, partial [Opitutaceae bacterium]
SPITAQAVGTTPVSIDVTASVNDPDGDPLVVTAETQPAAGGTAAFTAGTKIVTFTAAANFGGTATFNYTVSDGRGGTATASITVDVNRPPTAAAIAASANVSQTKTIDVTAFVSDPDTTDVLSLSALGSVTPANSAVISYTANSKVISFTANAGTGGTVTFPYTISDGRGGSATATVSVTVNRAPTPAADSQSVLVSTAAVFSVLANDTDPDGASATLGTPSLLITAVSAVTPSTLGTAQPSADGKSISFTSGASTGTGTFTYTVTDGGGLSANATVTVTVTAANQAPIATPQTLSPTTNPAIALQAKTINLTDPATGNKDVDSPSFFVDSAAGLPVGAGTLAISTDKTSVIYTPSLTASQGTGVQVFNYTLSDGQLSSAASTVTVTVNDRVVITSARAQRQQRGGLTTGYLWNISGTAGPGAVLTFRPGTSATGTPLTNAGTTVTVTAAANGAWSLQNFTQSAPGATQPTQVTVTSSQRGVATGAVSP